MKNYNDFQILNSDEYSKINSEYNHLNDRNKVWIVQVLTNLYSCYESINNCRYIKTTDRKRLLDSLSDTINLISQNSPDLPAQKANITDNVFILGNYLINSLEIAEKMAKFSNNQNNTLFYTNLKHCLLNLLNLLFLTLSKYNIKFFRHF